MTDGPGLRCTGCGRAFPVAEGVAELLPAHLVHLATGGGEGEGEAGGGETSARNAGRSLQLRRRSDQPYFSSSGAMPGIAA